MHSKYAISHLLPKSIHQTWAWSATSKDYSLSTKTAFCVTKNLARNRSYPASYLIPHLIESLVDVDVLTGLYSFIVRYSQQSKSRSELVCSFDIKVLKKCHKVLRTRHSWLQTHHLSILATIACSIRHVCCDLQLSGESRNQMLIDNTPPCGSPIAVWACFPTNS